MDRTLDSEEAARRLGVKVTTLYAYVSRGMLSSQPAPAGRRSLFDVEEVERLARRSRQGKSVETRLATITTGITQLSDDGPIYRGRAATDMATSLSYEEVAAWLWEAGDHPERERDARTRDKGTTRPERPLLGAPAARPPPRPSGRHWTGCAGRSSWPAPATPSGRISGPRP